LSHLRSSSAVVYIVAIHFTEQSVVHVCDTLKVTVSPSKFSMLIGISRYSVLPSEPISLAPIIHISVGAELGEPLGDVLGVALGVELGNELGE
jgi:hypothetical protein